eukprot:TRINITY_DN13908_c0_g1_i1.p1 TRINITY_DN13908_c0_g1~~TRINITY_DN13908_c0_g1_i1.p1  ORF type:complete len:158 (+),score=27.77 TRINITY_DN13908_c0_g1_i1:124-597(+)
MNARRSCFTIPIATMAIALLMVCATMPSTLEAATEKGFSLAVHGHYCGLNHGDGSYATKPLDLVDAACMNHDKCYDLHYLDCRCDYDFVILLSKLMKDPVLDPTLKGKVQLMSNWFTRSSCSCLRDGNRRNLLGEGEISLKTKGLCAHPRTVTTPKP